MAEVPSVNQRSDPHEPTDRPAADRSDRLKYSYHQGARLIRHLLDRIGEKSYTATPIDGEERDALYDMGIELHQLLYESTLFALRVDLADEDPAYGDDERYSDGRSVVSAAEPPSGGDQLDAIPAEAFCGGVGEDVPFGYDVYVWQPGDDSAPFADPPSAQPGAADHFTAWKASADLRADGLIEWSRNEAGRIIKRPGRSGRMLPVSTITADGVAECQAISCPPVHGRGDKSPKC